MSGISNKPFTSNFFLKLEMRSIPWNQLWHFLCIMEVMFFTSCFQDISFLFQENVVLCGLRNGTILAVDTRQKPGDFSGRLPQNRIPSHPEGHSTMGRSSARDPFQVSNAFVRRVCTFFSFCELPSSPPHLSEQWWTSSVSNYGHGSSYINTWRWVFWNRTQLLGVFWV